MEHSEAFTAAGYKTKNWEPKPRRRSHSDSELTAGSNPVKDGRRLKCFFCGSSDHMKPSCEAHKAHKEKLKERKGAEWREEEADKEDKPKVKTTLSLVGSGRGRGSAHSKFTMVLMAVAGDQGKETNDVFGEAGGEDEAKVPMAVAGGQGEEGTGEADLKVAEEEINALCGEDEQQEGEHEVGQQKDKQHEAGAGLYLEHEAGEETKDVFGKSGG